MSLTPIFDRLMAAQAAVGSPDPPEDPPDAGAPREPLDLPTLPQGVTASRLARPPSRTDPPGPPVAVPPRGEPPESDGSWSSVRLGDDALFVVGLALREATSLGHARCGSEHLLLGLVRSGHPAGQLLVDNGVALPVARRAVTATDYLTQARAAFGSAGTHPAGAHPSTREVNVAADPSPGVSLAGGGRDLVWTTGAAAALAGARRMARAAHADQVDLWHLLASLLEPGHGQCAAILLAVGVDPDLIAAGIRTLWADPPR